MSQLIPQEHGGSINRFVPGEISNPNGRPPKIYTIIKKSGYSKDDMRDAFSEIAWSDLSELKRLFEKEDSPAIVKVIAHAFKRAIEKGDYRYIKEIIEQAIGQPKESVEVKSNIIIEVTLSKNEPGTNQIL